jgi:hypothetical protein
MTGFVRKAILLGVAGLFAASAAMANVPDPARSTCGAPPNSTPPDPHRKAFVKVVGFTNANSPDAEAPAISNGNVGAQSCVTVKDFNGNVIVGIRVEADFSDCCDINLCSNTVNLVTCTPPVISGFTDAFGVFCYTAVGGAKDNGVYVQPNATNGAGLNCVEIRAGTVSLCRQTAVSYDQDGAIGPGNTRDGVDFTELSVVRSLITANAQTAGGRYRGRADYDCSGVIDFVDRSFTQTQVTRAAGGSGSGRGCVDAGSTFCTAKVPGPNCP